MARILIVDDDEMMLDFLAKALSKSGHDVTTRNNGKDALDLLQTDSSFDLILSDIIMPGIDGIELSNEAAKLLPKLKIMFITGFSAVALGNKNPAKTGKPVISKPFHLNDLVKRVDQMLAD